jgi:hypothetical protein
VLGMLCIYTHNVPLRVWWRVLLISFCFVLIKWTSVQGAWILIQCRIVRFKILHRVWRSNKVGTICNNNYSFCEQNRHQSWHNVNSFTVTISTLSKIHCFETITVSLISFIIWPRINVNNFFWTSKFILSCVAIVQENLNFVYALDNIQFYQMMWQATLRQHTFLKANN